MTFYTEKSRYTKTSLSDLQGAWGNFKHTLLTLHPFPEFDRIFFHLNEATSWEVVRDLAEMNNIYLLIRNICLKSERADELLEDLNEIKVCLAEAKNEYGN